MDRSSHDSTWTSHVYSAFRSSRIKGDRPFLKDCFEIPRGIHGILVGTLMTGQAISSGR